MSPSDTKLSREQLLGTWRLSACEGRAGDGAVLLPYSDHPQGMLTYGADGTMIVILMNPDRPQFASDDILKGTDEEVRAALEGFMAYCGRYVLDAEAGTVTHHLEQALFPNWVGTQQLRHASLADGQLSLATPPIAAGGQEWTFYLIWHR